MEVEAASGDSRAGLVAVVDNKWNLIMAEAGIAILVAVVAEEEVAREHRRHVQLAREVGVAAVVAEEGAAAFLLFWTVLKI